jgi:uncharacterized protein (DUF433 family)
LIWVGFNGVGGEDSAPPIGGERQFCYNAAMANHLSRIVSDPDICAGRPTIRNTRMRVSDVLDLLAAGETREGILADYPSLRDEDITAALEYASAAAAHRVIAAE